METWAALEGYEGLYEVSSHGRVRSFHGKGPRVLRNQKSSCGYAMVGLFKEGKRQPREVHRLVALTFLPNPEGKSDVNHLNGDPFDSRLDNLEWIDHKGNQRHAADRGVFDGRSNPRRSKKLTAESADAIRRERQQGATLNSLAARYGVCRAMVISIAKGRTWK